MSARTRLGVPVLAVALSLGCESTSAPPPDGTALGARVTVLLPDTTSAIAHEYYSGFGAPAQLVIADSWSWADTWAKLYASLRPRPSLPAVDFRTERVVLVALGGRSNGGYDIRIDSVARFERGSVTYVTATAPGNRCFTTQALTQPVDLIRVSSSMRPMTFLQRAVVRDCS
jgi:PrcB C-terminal